MAPTGRIVVATAREDLRHWVTRLAAIVGAAVEPVASSAAVAPIWRSAQVIVVGADLAPSAAAAGLARRADLVVVTDSEPDAGLWRAAVALGAARVLELPVDEPDLLDLLGAALDTEALGGRALAIVGGCGGAGASTFAAALAATYAAGDPAALIDGDVLGGGLDVLLGAEREPGARWSDLATARGRLGAADFSAALIRIDGLSVLSAGRSPRPAVPREAAVAVMDVATRAFATTVIDLPRRLDEVTTVLAGKADLVVVVVPATVRATAAAAAVIAGLARDSDELRLVVRDPGSGQLSVAEVADAIGVRAVTSLSSEPAVNRAAQRGQPPLRRRRGSLYDACRAVMADASGQ